MAGVTVNTGGAPGSGSEIRIRGGGSLNASNDPLIVVDGYLLERYVQVEVGLYYHLSTQMILNHFLF